MIHHFQMLDLNDRLQELAVDTSGGFAHAAIRSDPATYPCQEVAWHWHSQFELGMVASGSVELITQRGHYLFSTGDGYFINSNVLHCFKLPAGIKHTDMHTHLFDSVLISGSSLVLQQYVSRMDNCPEFDILPLRRDDLSHSHILRCAKNAFDAAVREDPCFEVDICANLMQAWRGVYQLILPLIDSGLGVTKVHIDRIKNMLTFIHNHYNEPINVPQIAAAAGLCARECFRCFHQNLGITPTVYLMRYRVQQSARMLLETDASVTEIALCCGFSSSSYFGKVFSDLMSCTPGQYRKNKGI